MVSSINETNTRAVRTYKVIKKGGSISYRDRACKCTKMLTQLLDNSNKQHKRETQLMFGVRDASSKSLTTL